MNTFARLAFLLTASLPVMSFGASNADVANKSPRFVCGISGRLLGTSARSFDDGQFLSGKGTLSCRSLRGADSDRVRHFPIGIKLIGIGRGIDLSVLRSTWLRSSAIGIHGNLDEILGSYSIRKSNGFALVRGKVDFEVPLHVVSHERGSFELGLKGRDAARLGARFYKMTLKIEKPDESHGASFTKNTRSIERKTPAAH